MNGPEPLPVPAELPYATGWRQGLAAVTPAGQPNGVPGNRCGRARNAACRGVGSIRTGSGRSAAAVRPAGTRLAKADIQGVLAQGGGVSGVMVGATGGGRSRFGNFPGCRCLRSRHPGGAAGPPPCLNTRRSRIRRSRHTRACTTEQPGPRLVQSGARFGTPWGQSRAGGADANADLKRAKQLDTSVQSVFPIMRSEPCSISAPT